MGFSIYARLALCSASSIAASACLQKLVRSAKAARGSMAPPTSRRCLIRIAGVEMAKMGSSHVCVILKIAVWFGGADVVLFAGSIRLLKAARELANKLIAMVKSAGITGENVAS